MTRPAGHLGRRLSVVLFLAAVALPPPHPGLSLASSVRPPGGVHSLPASRPGAEERAGATGSAPTYHRGINLVCADCHVVGTGSGATRERRSDDGGSKASAPLLLRTGDVTQLCLDCHDGRMGVPDVAGDDANGLHERSGGFFAPAGRPNQEGHDLTASRHAFGDEVACGGCHGGIASPGVTCIDCHDPHGNGNPRNLRWASNPDASPPLGLFSRPGVRGLEKYERANVAYGTRGSDQLREVSNLCLDCHHFFSGARYTDPDRDGIHSRHPSYDSERGDPVTLAHGGPRRSTDPGHWIHGSGRGFDELDRLPFLTLGASSYAEAFRVDPAANGVFCLTCHKAHGSGNPFGLNWSQAGTSARAGCDQCHVLEPEPEPQLPTSPGPLVQDPGR